MVLIEVRNSDGIVGRCDAKCYNAKHPNCDCVCGGKNHGAGLQTAMEQTKQYCEQWIEHYTRAKGLTEFESMVNQHVYQLSLPI